MQQGPRRLNSTCCVVIITQEMIGHSVAFELCREPYMLVLRLVGLTKVSIKFNNLHQEGQVVIHVCLLVGW